MKSCFLEMISSDSVTNNSWYEWVTVYCNNCPQILHYNSTGLFSMHSDFVFESNDCGWSHWWSRGQLGIQRHPPHWWCDLNLYEYLKYMVYTTITSILQGFYALASLLIYPFLLSAATTIMYFNIGVYAFVAVGVIIAFIPLQIILTKVHHKLRQVIT